MNKKVLGGVIALVVVLVGGMMLYLSRADDIKEEETVSFLDEYFNSVTLPEQAGTTFMPSGRPDDLFVSFEFDSADGKVEKNITLGPNKTVLEIKNPVKGTNKEEEIFLSDEQKDTIYLFLRSAQFDQIVLQEYEEAPEEEVAEGDEGTEVEGEGAEEEVGETGRVLTQPSEPVDEVLLSVSYTLLSGNDQRFVASEDMITYVDEEWQDEWKLVRELFEGLLAIYE